MDAATFERTLAEQGYREVATRTLPPHHATQPHAHEFEVRALVLAGEITLSVDGTHTSYRAGEVFGMARGRAHAECIGPDGVTTLAGRRYAD